MRPKRSLDGILDWTYQEEIFGRGNYRGFWFSPDGNWLAMLRIDISAIPPYVITDSATARGDGVRQRYSKAGDPIPHASLYLWDLRTIDSTGIPPAKLVDRSTPQEERIITGIWWHQYSSKLMYTISDRRQSWREWRTAGESFISGANRSGHEVVARGEPRPGWSLLRHPVF